MRRVRRTPEEARTAALTSARGLLIASGPDAVTLQAVAAEVGMSHTNLIHHFGSAAGLHTALMHEMVMELTSTLQSANARLREGKADVNEFVDIVFDAFDSGGAGRLAAWIALSGEQDHLGPVGEVVREHVLKVEAKADPAYENVHERVTTVTLLVTMAAFGDALIGDNLRQMVGRERNAVRKIMAQILPQIMVLLPRPREP